MAKKSAAPAFSDVLARLGGDKFDVSPAREGAGTGGANRVSKFGCAAEIAPVAANDRSPGDAGASVRVLVKGGWLLGGEIARLVDRGYQKFLKTPRLEIPATAEILKALHRFNDELAEACGGELLYNEAMGTTSDRYVYDRVKGRA